MALYERLMGLDVPKISPHVFMGFMAEFARGRVTATQAGDSLALSASERTEAGDLFATFTGTVAQKVLRAGEVNDVLFIAEKKLAPYDTPAAVRTRLGV